MSYNAIVLQQYPEALIDDETFATQSFNEQPLQQGEFRVQVSHLSLDPAMRGWVSPDPSSYIPPVQLGEVMRSLGFGVVTESLNENYPVGTQVTGMTGWTEQLIAKEGELSIVPQSVDAEMALSVLGMPGLTAYLGYHDILQAQQRQTQSQQVSELQNGKPQTIVVTGAAGAVGSVVVQMAVADGLRVVALAGSEDKVRWLKDELGVDAAINYKTDNVAEALTEATPDGIDLFFENTGGEAQHTVIERMNPHGKVAVCGLIADYHSATPAPAPSWINLIKRRATIEGFVITDHFYRAQELAAGIMPYLQQGKIQSRTHVLEGLEAAKAGVNMLYSGDNTGKLIVKL
ncbi:NADP-dependent oxidoreductase [Oceanospirillum beijerinckii]|uniref:NADP-dependent oxidoreductase n=1 Tax=Oceanospirillum beijerinckii TaxID=64976 RepID=UPI000400833F|nr:NADP-dependent oxidoreductase [Oceanospirillum beijerinckii]MAC46960.1 NADP-dependent oxidoreductase [Oceanospirillum sp.]